MHIISCVKFFNLMSQNDRYCTHFISVGRSSNEWLSVLESLYATYNDGKFFAELCGRVLSIEGYKRGDESLTMSNIWIKQGSSKTLLNISTSYL